jgi:membrane protein YqaA with SNARE-associated domain
MIIWRGLGILVPIIVGILSVFTAYVVNIAMKNEDYSKWHYWPKALGAILAAVAVWFLGRYLNSRPGIVVVEKDTGKEIVLRKTHDLFYLKFEYWCFVLLAFSVIGYFV